MKAEAGRAALTLPLPLPEKKPRKTHTVAVVKQQNN
jgi:hypothetical protein